jgi:acetylornithine deacetylase/succinyl-diaminopimelate desuccinylase-like protein
MDNILNFISDNESRYLDELVQFLRIPSISSSSTNKNDMIQAAEWLRDNIIESGVTETEIIPTEGHPIVYAEWLHAGPTAPTLLVYGHYDVQPVDPLNLWDSPPFEPVIKNNKIWARGCADDKGQLLTHVKSVEAFLKNNIPLPINIKFLFEGEEEANENHLGEFIINNKEKLKCDTVLVSDTEWYAEGLPSICYSLRGISFVELTVHGPKRDLHSGSYGGAVDNPLNVLCWMITQMKDQYGRIRIPGFYDDVLELDSSERNGFAALPFDRKEFCSDIGIPSDFGEFGYSILERVWARPTLDLNGIFGGYTGEGSKTIIPTHATAKISMRLVPNQNTKDITAKVIKYLESIAPPTVRIEIKAAEGGNPVMAPRDSKGVKAAIYALRKAFGKEPVFMREGGSIPIVGMFDTVLNAPTVLMGLSLAGDNIHSPNENFDLNHFFGGIRASAIFINEFSKM